MNKLAVLVFVSSFLNCFVHGITRCPAIVTQMPGLSMNKALGTWYILAYDGITDNASCTKATLSQPTPDTLADAYDRIVNGKRESYTFNLKADPTRPGVFTVPELRDVYDSFGNPIKQKFNREYLITFTDYDNLIVFYSCLEIKHATYTQIDYNYFIGKRNRNFDSLSLVLPIFQGAVQYGFDLNRLIFEKNDNTCPN